MKKLFSLVLIFSLISCGPKLPPDISKEGKIAVRGTQIIAALRTTLPALKMATCQPGVTAPCLAPADTDKVVGYIQSGSKIAQDLALVLVEVDGAQTAALQSSYLEKAHTLLVSLHNVLTQAAITPNLEDGRQKVVAILSTVNNLLLVALAFE